MPADTIVFDLFRTNRRLDRMNRYAEGLNRWLPTVTMMLVSMVSYIDRNTLALLIPTIRRDTNLTAEQYGFIVSAFSIAYMIGNPLWGALLDRYGVRRGMMAAVGLWSVASAAHAAVASFWGFALCRFVLGFGEGATFPGAFRTAQQTLELDRRGRGVALSYSGGSLGAILTPILMTPVAAAFGWRGAFVSTGVMGALWMVWWSRLSRRPDLSVTPPSMPVEWTHWQSPRLWGALAAYSMGSVPLGFVLYNASLYLSARFGLTQSGIGSVLWIPPLGWECGYFFWGWLLDRAGPRSTGRLMAAAMVLSLPLGFAPQAGSLPVFMLMLFFAMFVASGFIIPSIHHATRVMPSSASGLVAGLGAGSFSLLTALLAPLFGRWFDAGDYQTAFAVAAVFPVAGYAWFATAERRSAASTSTTRAEQTPTLR